MEIKVSFNSSIPADKVWEAFQDIPDVMSCIPGLEMTETSDDSTYAAKMSMKLGPVSAAFEGECTVIEVDQENRSATIKGKGVDKRGGSRASATAVYSIIDAGDTTTVDVSVDLKMTGTLAQMGRSGIMQDVANQVTQQFSEGLERKLSDPVETDTDNTKQNQETNPTQAPAQLNASKFIWPLIVAQFKRLFHFIFRLKES